MEYKVGTLETRLKKIKLGDKSDIINDMTINDIEIMKYYYNQLHLTHSNESGDSEDLCNIDINLQTDMERTKRRNVLKFRLNQEIDKIGAFLKLYKPKNK